MDFSTTTFWLSSAVALSLLLIGNILLRNSPLLIQKFHKFGLLVFSLTLLGSISIETLGIFILVTIVAWFGCKWGKRAEKNAKRTILACLVIILLLPLFYYKYSDFVINGIGGQEWDTLRDLIIPLGLSFYSFQIIGFCIDTVKNNADMPVFIDYLNFASFFPQIVAGPIERRSDLLPQMQALNLKLRTDNIRTGLPYIILGLFFKLVMADNLALAFHAHYQGDNAMTIWLNNILFTFRIYFDFAGYGLTAYGIAACMGIRLRMNFLSPYTASNISEFWRRWHTSLTLWFRDYIYFPMGGSRTSRWALNIVLVFAISGIWHGAGWNFMIWGSLAGIAMVAHRLFRIRGFKLPGIVGWVITFSLMVIIWMFFHETHIPTLQHQLAVIVHPENYNISAFVQEVKDGNQAGAIAIVFTIISFIIIGIEYMAGRKKQDTPYGYFITPAACGIMTALMILLGSREPNPFIYFVF